MEVLQKSRSTLSNRYPHLFLTSQAWAEERSNIPKGGGRILCFGCADGSEMTTLGCYFPNASIFGCDVSNQGFENNVAAQRTGYYFDSMTENIAIHGKFDLIFANSVLCAYPLRSDIMEEFSFPTFENWCAALVDNLTDGGLLVLYNTSYFLQDTECFQEVRPVRSPMLYSAGWVPKWTPNHELVTDIGSEGEPIFKTNMLTLDRQLDCCFEKSAGSHVNVHVGVTEPAATRVLGKTTTNRASAQLERTLIETENGSHYLRNQWRFQTADQTSRALEPWWQPAQPDSLEFQPPACFDTLPPRPRSASDSKTPGQSVSGSKGPFKRLARRLRKR